MRLCRGEISEAEFRPGAGERTPPGRTLVRGRDLSRALCFSGCDIAQEFTSSFAGIGISPEVLPPGPPGCNFTLCDSSDPLLVYHKQRPPCRCDTDRQERHSHGEVGKERSTRLSRWEVRESTPV